MPDYLGAEIKQDFYNFMLKVLGLRKKNVRRPILFVDTKSGLVSTGEKDRPK